MANGNISGNLIQFIEAAPILNKLHELEKGVNTLIEKLTKSTPAANSNDDLLTRKEVCKLLQVSLVTLHHWNKKDILKPYRIGNQLRYKRSDVMAKFAQKGGNKQ